MPQQPRSLANPKQLFRQSFDIHSANQDGRLMVENSLLCITNKERKRGRTVGETSQYEVKRAKKRFTRKWPCESFMMTIVYFLNQNFAILMATTAHSSPLFPSFPPARSFACCRSLVVRSPSTTGISLFTLSCAMPCVTPWQM